MICRFSSAAVLFRQGWRELLPRLQRGGQIDEGGVLDLRPLQRIEHLQLGLKPRNVGVACGLDHHATLWGVLQRIERPEQ